MRLTVDKEADALCFRLDETPGVDSEEVQPGVGLDFSAEGTVVGVEILGLSKHVPADALRNLHFQAA